MEVTATRNRMGFWTYTDYDAFQRISAMTNANGVVTRYGYCDCDALTYVTNAFGTAEQEVTQYVYDDAGRRVQTILPDGSVLNHHNDSLGRQIITLDVYGGTTNIYDNLSRLFAVKNAAGEILHQVIQFWKDEKALKESLVILREVRSNFGKHPN